MDVVVKKSNTELYIINTEKKRKKSIDRKVVFYIFHLRDLLYFITLGHLMQEI